MKRESTLINKGFLQEKNVVNLWAWDIQETEHIILKNIP